MGLQCWLIEEPAASTFMQEEAGAPYVVDQRLICL
jgi:hypothetical protein